MEKLIVLGTGNAMVTKCYNTCFALQQGDEYVLVDAAEVLLLSHSSSHG